MLVFLHYPAQVEARPLSVGKCCFGYAGIFFYFLLLLLPCNPLLWLQICEVLSTLRPTDPLELNISDLGILFPVFITKTGLVVVLMIIVKTLR